MKTNLFIIATAALLVASYLFGLSVGERKMLAEARILMNGAQADLLYNRLAEEREMALMLSKGCISQTQERLNIDLDQDTALLAKFFKGKLDVGSKGYIFDRDPALVASLATFKSKYGNSWTEKACK